jgi:hypothetical protein
MKRIIRLTSTTCGSPINVVEYTLAKEILYRLGYGQRREDGDTLLIFAEREHSFYVKRDVDAKVIAHMSVDEGFHDDGLYAVGEGDTRVGGFSPPWCELVDATQLLRLVCSKLLPDEKFTNGGYMSHNRNAAHACEQYVVALAAWSETQGKLADKHPVTMSLEFTLT